MLASIVWGTWLIKKHALLLKDPIALQEALAVEEHLALRDIFALECLQTRFNVRLKPCQATIVLEALLFLYHALQATIALEEATNPLRVAQVAMRFQDPNHHQTVHWLCLSYFQ